MYEIMGNGVILALITTKLLANVAFSEYTYYIDIWKLKFISSK